MSLIWASRGRDWGFRFLLDGGFADPLPIYDKAFAGSGSEREGYRRVGEIVALRFADPLGRKDSAGRIIPHEFVVFSPLADKVTSVEHGREVVWPIVRGKFARIWRLPKPPSENG